MSSAVSCELETVLEPYESDGPSGRYDRSQSQKAGLDSYAECDTGKCCTDRSTVCTLCDSQPTWTGESRKMTLADSVHECGL